MKGFFLLLKRNLKRILGKRFFILLLFMVLFQSWFILGSGYKDKAGQTLEFSYMGFGFAFLILGSLAALSLNFDGISRERQNKVMDLLLTSSLSKTQIVAGKLAAALISSFLFSLLYNTVVTMIYCLFGSNGTVAIVALRNVLPVAALIFIYSLMGLFLSVLFRSSRTSFIVSMACGLLLMPRILEMFTSGISKALNLGNAVSNILMFLSPAMIMSSLTGYNGVTNLLTGIAALLIYVLALVILFFAVFRRQDEMSYNE
jgi:ABC-type transport system involved in multi-copper enzyme maturation permease subunit